MKTTLMIVLFTLSFSSFAKDKPSEQTKTKDIYHEVRDILR